MYVLEILNNLGNKVAQLTDKECTVNIFRTINGEWTITINYIIPKTGSNKKEYFELWKARARIRNTVNGDYQTFVLQRPEFRKTQTGSCEIIAYGDHISIDTMRFQIINEEHDFQQANVINVLQKILLYSNYAVGTVSIADKISLKISYESVLSALNKLVSIIDCEYSFNEIAGQISIVKRIGSSNFVNVRYEKNLKSISRKILNSDVINKLYGVGGGSPPATISGALHSVYSIENNSIVVDNNKVVIEDSCWNDYFVKFITGDKKGYRFKVIGCSHGTTRDSILLDCFDTIITDNADTYTVPDIGNFTISSSINEVKSGDKFQIVDESGLGVDNLFSPSSISTYGIYEDVYKNSSHGDLKNYVKSSDFDDNYLNGLCENWALIGSITLSENTNVDYIKYGVKSQRLISNNNNSYIYQDVTIEQGKYYTVFANVFIVDGVISFGVNINDKTYKVKNEIGSTGWQTLKFDGLFASSGTVKILFTGEESVNCYLDSVGILESVINNDGIVEERKYVNGCEQTVLWIETFNELTKRKIPKVEYTVNFIDLYNLDQNKYMFDKISIGDIVILNDEDIGIKNVFARVSSMKYNPFMPHLTEHTITTAI